LAAQIVIIGTIWNSGFRHLVAKDEKPNPQYIASERRLRDRPIIDARHLTKVYRMEAVEVVALCDVSLVVYEGEFIGAWLQTTSKRE
jgi:hypothetical protein